MRGRGCSHGGVLDLGAGPDVIAATTCAMARAGWATSRLSARYSIAASAHSNASHLTRSTRRAERTTRGSPVVVGPGRERLRPSTDYPEITRGGADAISVSLRFRTRRAVDFMPCGPRARRRGRKDHAEFRRGGGGDTRATGIRGPRREPRVCGCPGAGVRSTRGRALVARPSSTPRSEVNTRYTPASRDAFVHGGGRLYADNDGITPTGTRRLPEKRARRRSPWPRDRLAMQVDVPDRPPPLPCLSRPSYPTASGHRRRRNLQRQIGASSSATLLRPGPPRD